MSDPVRWRDPGGLAPPGVRELLEQARGTRAMTAAERARSAARVARLAALPQPTGTLAALKGVAGAAGIGAASAIVLLGAIKLAKSNHEVTASSPVVEAPTTPASAQPNLIASAAASADTLPPDGVAPAPQVASATPAIGRSASGARSAGQNRSADKPDPSPAPSTSASGGASEGDSLAREVALLSEAGALVAGNPSKALSLLEEHRKVFPQGKLGLERETLLIDALLHLGRQEEAHALGKALLPRLKGSLYEERVRRMLGKSP